MEKTRTLVAIIVFSLFVLATDQLSNSVGTVVVYAQDNTTNTTNTTNITITVPALPNVTPIQRPEASVGLEFYDNDTVSIVYSCFYYVNASLCPNVTLVLRELDNNTVIFNQSYMVDPPNDCRDNFCRYMLLIDVPIASTYELNYTLYYADNTTRNHIIILKRPVESIGVINLALTLLPFAVFIGLAVRLNILGIGLGALLVPAIVYALNRAGLTDMNLFVVNTSIALALIALFIWGSRRRAFV